MDAQFILDHSIVEVVGVSSVGAQIVSNQILCPSLTVLHLAVLEVIIRRNRVAVPKDLRLGTKVLLLILREVVHGSLVLVQGAQVLIVIRILVIIERVHSLVSAINGL